ncbi:hypothetical protein MXE28_09415 [Veillonella sp. KGMB01456]|uniref:hypothetical protein n=1 Tax=Veillonella sp. KGMB01456 TaxID=2934794 RepID=UPI001FF68653|nr:hypothetical protein [Veillonella sp. KGMB01456]MCK0529574.1 hypothetical protein [Veillonella sp. KGMB01456]DAH82838.1 MAG TPA: hypothetical protein [Caudoviricetes sp.]
MNLLTRLSNVYKAVKGADLKIGNLLFYEIIIGISLLPLIFVVFLLLYIWFAHITDDWAFKVVEYAIRIINAILTGQVMACIIAYGAKLKDSNSNGISDDDERGTK